MTPTQTPIETQLPSSLPISHSGPLFSVVSVTLNCRSDALESARTVWAQDCSDYEYVVKDGCSSDGTPQAIAAEGPARVFVTPDVGIFDAMNQSLRSLRGSYVYFLNAGDLFAHPGALTRAKLALEQQSWPDLLFCYVKKLSNGETLVYPPRPGPFLLYRRGICQQAVFFRRDLFDRLGGFDLNLPYRADQDFVCRCLLKSKVKSAVVPEILAHYQGGGHSDSKRANSPLDEEKAIIARRYFSTRRRVVFSIVQEASLWRLRRWLVQGGKIPLFNSAYYALVRVFNRL